MPNTGVCVFLVFGTPPAELRGVAACRDCQALGKAEVYANEGACRRTRSFASQTNKGTKLEGVD